MKFFLSPILFLLVFLVHAGCGKLVFLQWVFTHGNKSPHNLYPNDPNTVRSWPEGLGKFTQLGKRQHYVLGKQLRQLYSDFIPDDTTQVTVNSTGKMCCELSCKAQLEGLYEPAREWRNIPIDYYADHMDQYLNEKVKCPKFTEESQRIYATEEYRKFLKKNEPMLQELSTCAGERLTQEKAVKLANTLLGEMDHRLEILPCMLPYYYQLQEYRDYIENAVYHSPAIARIRGGPLFGEVLDNMNKKIDGEISHQELKIFAARDSSMMSLLSSLKEFHGETPPYCDTLVFELHNIDDSFYVRLLHLNSTRPEDGGQTPHVLRVPDCSKYCPVEDFEKFVKPLVPSRDFDKECGK